MDVIMRDLGTERRHYIKLWKPDYSMVLQCAMAAVRKYQQLGGLNNKYLISYRSGGWKSKIKVLVGLVPFVACERESVP